MLLPPYPKLHDSWRCCFGLALFAGTENNMHSLRKNLATGVAVSFYRNWKSPTNTQNNFYPSKGEGTRTTQRQKQNREKGRGKGKKFSGFGWRKQQQKRDNWIKP